MAEGGIPVDENEQCPYDSYDSFDEVIRLSDVEATNLTDDPDVPDLTFILGGGSRRYLRTKRFSVARRILDQRYPKFTEDKAQSPIWIENVLPHIFRTLLLYVYQGIEPNFPQWKTSDIIQLYIAAEFYGVVGLLNPCKQYMDENIRDKSIFWLMEHCHINKIDQKWTDYLHQLHHFAVNDITASIKYLCQVCLEKVLRHRNIPWLIHDRFLVVSKWAAEQCRRDNLQVNVQNQRDKLGNVINLIDFARMATTFFMNSVYYSNILSEDELRNFILCFLARSRTRNVDETREPNVLTFQRFGNVLTGKVYRSRQNLGRENENQARGTQESENRTLHPNSHAQRERVPAFDRTGDTDVPENEIVSEDDETQGRSLDQTDMDTSGHHQVNPHTSDDTASAILDDDNADTISFICSHDAYLKFIMLYGSDQHRACKYSVDLWIFEEADTEIFHKHYNLDTDGFLREYELAIYPVVNISKEKVYTLYVVMRGVTSYFGVNGSSEVRNEDMTVIFIPNGKGLNGTTQRMGQFPGLKLQKKRIANTE